MAIAMPPLPSIAQAIGFRNARLLRLGAGCGAGSRRAGAATGGVGFAVRPGRADPT